MSWKNVSKIQTRNFRCGNCGEKISSQIGFYHESNPNHLIYVCHNCDCPNIFLGDKRYPGDLYGEEVDNVPKNITDLYRESRKCVSVQSYTASVMASRKLLMNISVDKGTQEGLKFIEYVNYLDENHYTPPNSKDWVDYIRSKGNEANHEIKIMTKKDAEELIDFIEMLLRFIYEYPGRIKDKQESQGSEGS